MTPRPVATQVMDPRRGAAVALAFGVPLVSTGGTLLEETHRLSDSLGGLLAAVTLSTGCLVVHELAREEG
ncbi:MAG: hypothetical protein H7247_14480 [Polaromonas sp.]|nr:hypothetical protein [Gemmatimonadaceae bacterium]